MANIIIPGIVLMVIIYGMYKKIDIYDAFIDGVKEGMKLILNIFPTLFTMVIAIDIFVKCGIISDLTNLISPLFEFLSFPKEIFPLAIMRPISGSSSLVLLNDILKTYGADSYIGRIASVIEGSTDTTIYILGLYFSSVGIKKTKYALVAGLLADLIAVILSVIVINILF